jgi:hypothetical protein
LHDPRETFETDALHVLLLIIEEFQILVKQLRLAKNLVAQMFVNGFELPRDFLAHIKIEILGHNPNFLGPSDGKLIIWEILHSLPQQVRTIDPGD